MNSIWKVVELLLNINNKYIFSRDDKLLIICLEKLISSYID